MKKILLAAGLVAFGGQATAFAADIAPMPSAVDWSGTYIGAHIGYGFGDQDWTLVDNPGDGGNDNEGAGGPPIGSIVASHDLEGFFGGIQSGYNLQNGNFVFGIEAELAFTDIDGSESRISSGEKPGPREWATDINWLATLGPRLGYAFDSTLLYAEGGLALSSQDNYHLGAYGGPPVDPPPDPAPPGREYDDSGMQMGWFLGAGLEQAFSEHWSGRIEYNYVALSNEVKLWGNPANPAVFDIDQDIQVIKVGLNYRFGM